MALVAVNLDHKLYERVAGAVATGDYTSIQHFLQTAAWNQIALEESASGGELATVVDRPPRQAQTGRLPADASQPDEWRVMVRRIDVPLGRELSTPSPLNGKGRAIWGQTNRVLPIAVGVRVLRHLEAAGPVSVLDWHERATRVATDLRPQLREWDVAAGRRHGSLWATAFPDDNPASAHRYVNQFLGAPRGKGLSDGGAAFLGFVSFTGTDSGAEVELTKPGVEWANIPNPIFDLEEGQPDRTFSVEETMYYLDHLHLFRLGEYGLLESIAALVAKGRSRTQIDASLAQEHPAWSTYVGTMRAGALGRLLDLGLLERVRHGLHVEYALTVLAAEVGLGTGGKETSS